MRPSRIVARFVAAALVAAATVLVAPAAYAATCADGHGVSVVVDYHELGGGVQSGCVPDGAGRAASALFPDAGFALDYAQRQPGFVCRVAGRPADSPCVNTPPADAYWALWWSDGKSGAWTYATTGAGGLKVPDGGYVAFSWQGSSARSQPGLRPAAHPTSTSSPSSKPSSKPSSSPSSKPSSSPSSRPTKPPSSSGSAAQTSPSSGTPSGPTSTSPSAEASVDGKPGGKQRSPTASTEPTASSEPTGSSEPGEPSESPAERPEDGDVAPAASEAAADDGLPGWVAPVAIGALFAGAGVVALLRRRRTSTGP